MRARDANKLVRKASSVMGGGLELDPLEVMREKSMLSKSSPSPSMACWLRRRASLAKESYPQGVPPSGRGGHS